MVTRLGTILIVFMVVIVFLRIADWYIVLTREPAECTGSEGYE